MTMLIFMKNVKSFLYILILLLISNVSLGQYTFSGRITNTNNIPIEYVSITDKDNTVGTMTDDKGFFSLKLPSKQYVFIIRYIGYEEKRDSFLLNENIQKDYTLQEEDLSTDEIYITADGRDPAFGIIQKAIDAKNKNVHPFPQYQYHAYTKTIIGFPSSFNPDSLNMDIGISIKSKKQKEEAKKEDIPEFKSKILYLSETFSEMKVQEPEKVKETILSSRVSGDKNSYSMFGNMISRFEPYDNRLVIEGMSDRGIISPVADNAFFYYDFKLLGATTTRGQKTYKIQILPKRLYDPVFRGTIYISDSSYAIKEIDVFTTKEQQLDVMDTLRLKQQYTLVEGKWLPYTTRMGFDFIFDLGVVKLPLAGFSISLLSEFNVQPQLDKKTFNAEIISITDTALNHPKSFWDKERPIPLTTEELFDYHLKDSLEQARNNPHYLDSMQHHHNTHFDLNNVLLLGKTFRYRKSNTEIYLHPVLEAWGFNPMEGFFIAPEMEWRKKFAKERKLTIKPLPRYAFSSQKFSYKIEAEYISNPKSLEKWKLAAGDYVQEFSNIPQIDVFFNTITCLFYKRSNLKLYQQKFAQLTYEREFFNGFMGSFTLGYYDRTNLQNITNYSFAQRKHPEPYSPNSVSSNPYFSSPMPHHHATIAEATLTYTPGTQYISVPYQKINSTSKYPSFQLTYIQAIPFQATDASYQKIKTSIYHKTPLGILGSLSWRLSAGQFLSRKQTYFPDMFHFKGNETKVHVGNFDVFYLMPYYVFSNPNPYLETHLEQSFQGFLLNKVPLIRKLHLNEYVGLHFLKQSQSDPYLELNIGVEKMLMKVIPLRIDFNMRLLGNVGPRYSYKVISQDIGEGGQIKIE